jgi:tRNA threonylcarbamoyladenosine biosynthesis protein TsaB
MLVLGIDTSCASAGAALVKDGELVGRVAVADRRTHSVKLLPEIQALLAQNNIDPSELDLICVNTGPGSFTGVRIGASTAKTMAFALGIPVAGVNTLDSLVFDGAADTRPEGGEKYRLALIDARNLRAYGCLYKGARPLTPFMVDHISVLTGAVKKALEGEPGGVKVEVAGDAALNEEIAEVLRGCDFPEFDIDAGRSYPDPFAVAELGTRAYVEAPDREAFLPGKLVLNYMKDW